MLVCNRCKAEHNEEQFKTCARCREYSRRAVRKWYVKNPGSVASRTREWEKKNPKRVRENLLKCKYGIEPGTYDRMLNEQNGVCAICLSPPLLKPLYVDHNHTNKLVRALLCHNCNAAIGHVKESWNIAERLAAYIRKYQEQR